jgi:hypothetical protein
MVQSPNLLRLLLAGCLCIALFVVAFPMYVIRPFRAQGAGELAVALAVRSWAPYVAAGAAVIASLAVLVVWKQSRSRRERLLSALVAAFTVLCSALSQVNVFELMFHRIDAPKSIAADEAKLDADDMVLAIRAGGHARAYPIRMMGYHHIVNDWVGGVPVVGTY